MSIRSSDHLWTREGHSIRCVYQPASLVLVLIRHNKRTINIVLRVSSPVDVGLQAASHLPHLLLNTTRNNDVDISSLSTTVSNCQIILLLLLLERDKIFSGDDISSDWRVSLAHPSVFGTLTRIVMKLAHADWLLIGADFCSSANWFGASADSHTTGEKPFKTRGRILHSQNDE